MQQQPLDIGEFVYIRDRQKGLVLAELRDVFADEVLVALKAKDTELLTVHRSHVARIDYGPYLH